jgi:PST family polysaccharide transporter
MTQHAQKMARGSAWNVAANIAKISAGLVVLPILTRILSADEFGLIQMAMPVIVFTMVFNNAGVGPALVRADTCSDALWSSAFWANIGIGVVFTGLLVVTAPLIALFYGNNAVIPLIVALSMAIVLQTASIVPGAWLQREFQFKHLAIADIVGNGLGVAVVITTALLGFGVWSLVLQQLVTHAARTAYLWWRSAPPVGFAFDWPELKSITGFSINVNLADLANFFGRNADNIIIGRQFGTAELGYYSIAYRLMLLPIQVFSWGIATVLLPGLAQMKDNADRLCAACMRVFKIVSVVTFPIMAGACALSEPLIVQVLGENMRPAATLLAILAPVGAMQSLSSSHGAIFMAIGRADIMFRWSLFCNVVIVGAFIIAVPWGVTGVALAYLIVNLLLAPPGYWILFRLMGLSMGRFLGGIAPIALAAVGMGVVVWWTARLLGERGVSELDTLLVCIPLGVVVYGGAVVLAARSALVEVVGLARQATAR